MITLKLKDGSIKYIPSRFLSSVIFIIKNNKKILVDPGRRSFINEKIDEIYITHLHPDHLFYLKYFPNVPIFIHPEGIKYINAKNPYLSIILREIKEIDKVSKGIKGIRKIIIYIFSRFFVLLFGMFFFRNERFKNKFIPLKNGDERYGIKIFYTPGHSPDSISLFFPDDKILISGDLIVKRRPFSLNLLIPTSDIEDALKSCKFLKNLEPEIILPGHGYPIFNAKRKLQETLYLTEKEIECVKNNRKRNLYLTYFLIQRCLKNKSIMARLSSIVFYSKFIYKR